MRASVPECHSPMLQQALVAAPVLAAVFVPLVFVVASVEELIY